MGLPSTATCWSVVVDAKEYERDAISDEPRPLLCRTLAGDAAGWRQLRAPEGATARSQILTTATTWSRCRSCAGGVATRGWSPGSTNSTVDLFVSVISIGEIERGIAAQRASNPGFAAALARWLDTVLALYGERILPFDLSGGATLGLAKRGPGQRERGPHDCGNGAGARPYHGYSQCGGFRACARSRIESIPASATSFTGVRARLGSCDFRRPGRQSSPHIEVPAHAREHVAEHLRRKHAGVRVEPRAVVAVGQRHRADLCVQPWAKGTARRCPVPRSVGRGRRAPSATMARKVRHSGDRRRQESGGRSDLGRRRLVLRRHAADRVGDAAVDEVRPSSGRAAIVAAGEAEVGSVA